MNLYELTCDASQKLNTYKHPDLDEWIEAIDPILNALGECMINNDQVYAIDVEKTYVNIITHYSVRCCSQSNDMTIPIEVLNAEDPIKKAKQIKASKNLEETEYEITKLKKQLSSMEEKLTKCQKIYEEVML
jgi:hypothetical protein